ncbi:MAG: response regulator [Bacteroidetes bacterium]|nr:response regulator [Bacteroidota bacterium]
MKKQTLSISAQIKIGFSSILILVLGLLFFLLSQNITLTEQTKTIYGHPLQVRASIAEIQQSTYREMAILRDATHLYQPEEYQSIVHSINAISDDAEKSFENIKSNYLGNPADVTSAQDTYEQWSNLSIQMFDLITNGKSKDAILKMSQKGEEGKSRELVFEKLAIIDDFAKRKADSIYEETLVLADKMIRDSILLAICMLTIAILITYYLIKQILTPIRIMANTTERFKNGDLSARNSYKQMNEFGHLADSINLFADKIQASSEMSTKVIQISEQLLSKYEAKEFFHDTLNTLLSFTNSQMTAVYLIDNEKQNFNHFDSIGVDDNARKSFSAINSEGEFGAAISTKEIQHLKNISENTRFQFYSFCGKIIPKEIITIPILANNEIIAIISLASINGYTQNDLQLIKSIYPILCTRIEGIIAYHAIQTFSESLELQNQELSVQKTELAAQSSDLRSQNTILEIQKNQLNEVSRLKTNFLSNMSHELRTPLNSIIALTGLLSRKLIQKVSEEEYSYLEVIERNGKSLLYLINDILDIARIESGKEEIDITKFNLNILISEIVTMIQPQILTKAISVHQKNKENVLFISSDSDKLKHVLQNLIGNAIKFTEKGTIEIISEKDGENIIIKVIDTGIGIHQDQLPHIFDEFRQADGSTSRKYGGTGLGLAIAKKYIQLLGGSISVTSILGTGSEFNISLPVNYQSSKKELAIEGFNELKYPVLPPVPNPEHSIKTILLIDDSEAALLQMKYLLEESGFHILVAENGQAAFDILENNIPDVIVLDLMMPGIDGFHVLKNLRAQVKTENIPVLILTAKLISKEELLFFNRNNVHQLIQKGDVKRSELLAKINLLLYPAHTIIPKNTTDQSTAIIKPLVLVVEDNPDNLLTIKALLDGKYQLIEATDGIEALEIIKKQLPNLVLMDIALPRQDGIQTFLAIQQDELLKHIPVIAITASAMNSDRESILAHGFRGYISKPIDHIQFHQMIKEVLYGL